jgi:2-polyprenyl-6-methoxyphenol hydroxylase-like FAD-dependent oxidoreductase
VAVRDVAIVGAGQGGLHLALGLLEQGRSVTLVSDKTPDAFLGMNPMSSHTLQGRSLDAERAAGANLADDLALQPTRGFGFAVSPDGQTPALAFEARWDKDAAAIDTRLKCCELLRRVARAGAEVITATATLADVEQLADEHRAVFMATGKGELRSLFALDEDRTVYDRPQRELLLLLVDGMQPERPEQNELVNFVIRPGIGEMFFSPNYHMARRRVSTLLMESVPGGPMALWKGATGADEVLDAAKRVVAEFVAWESPTMSEITLADPKAFVSGAVTPQVRKPTGRLPNGRAVYAIGDITIVHDPAAGLGGNCTATQVDGLLSALRDRGDVAIDADWYERQFEEFWVAEGRWFQKLANLVIEPLTDPVAAIFGAAASSPAVGAALARGWAAPATLWPALGSAEASEQFIARAEADAVAA